MSHVKYLLYISNIIKRATNMIIIHDYNESPKRQNKYPNGYQPKIEYWQYKANKAVANLDVEAARYALQKLEYFLGRQAEVNERLSNLYND